MDRRHAFDRPEEADTPPAAGRGVADPQARLAALAAHLGAHGYKVEWYAAGLRVVNPGAPGCCAEVRRRADFITCRKRASDGGQLWFVTSWQEPISEADRVTDAVTRIKGYLGAPS